MCIVLGVVVGAQLVVLLDGTSGMPLGMPLGVLLGVLLGVQLCVVLGVLMGIRLDMLCVLLSVLQGVLLCVPLGCGCVYICTLDVQSCNTYVAVFKC